MKHDLTLFRMDLFRAAHGWGAKKLLLVKTFHIYSAMINICADIPYLRKTQEIYESLDSPLDLC